MTKIINKCKLCHIRGLCCYESVIINDLNLILTNRPCNFLDTKNRLCTVYKQRHEKRKDCVSIRKGKRNGALALNCLYLKSNKKFDISPKTLPPKNYPPYLKNIYDHYNKIIN